MLVSLSHLLDLAANLYCRFSKFGSELCPYGTAYAYTCMYIPIHICVCMYEHMYIHIYLYCSFSKFDSELCPYCIACEESCKDWRSTVHIACLQQTRHTTLHLCEHMYQYGNVVTHMSKAVGGVRRQTVVVACS